MKLGIYGAGGLGREVLCLAQIINAVQSRWDDFFFIDDFNPGRVLNGHRVTDFISIGSSDDVEIIIAVGEPSGRAQLFEKVKANHLTLTTLIHPAVFVPESTQVGDGAVLCQGVYVSCDATLADNVFIQPNTSIAHDCYIGEHSVLSTYTTLGGRCRIGTRTFIGMSVSVKECTKIGDDTIIGMGSVIVTDIESGVVAFGNPGRVKRKNESKRVFKL